MPTQNTDPYHLRNFTQRFLYQIFYDYNKFDKLGDLDELQPFVYTPESVENLKDLFKHSIDEPEEENIQQIEVYEKPVQENIQIEKPTVMPKTFNKQLFDDDHFVPKHQDSLFWCIFYGVYGENEYKQVGHRFDNRESEEKQKITQYFRTKDIKLLKNTNQKITNADAQEILSDFMCIQNKTSLLSLIGLVVYYKRTIYLVHNTKKMYMRLSNINEEHEPIVIDFIYNSDNVRKSKYILRINDVSDYIENVIKTHFEYYQYNKPFMGVSNYKIEDLREIALKFKLDCLGKNKTQLYKELLEYCVWEKLI